MKHFILFQRYVFSSAENHFKIVPKAVLMHIVDPRNLTFCAFQLNLNYKVFKELPASRLAIKLLKQVQIVPITTTWLATKDFVIKPLHLLL